MRSCWPNVCRETAKLSPCYITLAMLIWKYFITEACFLDYKLSFQHVGKPHRSTLSFFMRRKCFSFRNVVYHIVNLLIITEYLFLLCRLKMWLMELWNHLPIKSRFFSLELMKRELFSLILCCAIVAPALCWFFISHFKQQQAVRAMELHVLCMAKCRFTY